MGQRAIQIDELKLEVLRGVKTVDERTRSKTSINELLRD